MKNIIIVGTGAVAAELTSYIEDNNKKVEPVKRYNLIGYIEYEYNIENYWAKYQLNAPVLCDIDAFEPQPNVELLIGISDIFFRNLIINKLIAKNAQFASFIHHSVIIPDTVKLGVGNIIYPYCIIGPNSEIGNYNMITSYSFISHDCIIGSGNFFSTAGLAGRVRVGNDNFFGIRSTIIPSVKIGNKNIIQAGMVVDKSINDDTTVFYRYKEKVLAIPKSNL